MIGRPRTEWQSIAELFALSGLAVAQPAFDLIAKNRDLLVTHRTRGTEIVLLTVAVLVVPPAVLWAFERIVGFVAPGFRPVLHALLAGVLAGVFGLELAKSSTDWTGAPLVIVGIGVGILVTVAMLRTGWLSSALRYLAIAPPLFAVWMLAFTPVADVAFAPEPAIASVRVGHPGRVVVVVLDEFPLMSLLDGAGHVDAELYPNLAALAAGSHWFRNHSTVSPYTATAVPAILTGQFPDPDATDTDTSSHPRNVFTLLGNAFDLNVHEIVTHLCPPSRCAESDATGVAGAVALGDDLADLWREFASPSRPDFTFQRERAIQRQVTDAHAFIRSLTPSTPGRPRLDFAHIELPHQPWHLTPTGQDTGATGPLPGAADFRWTDGRLAEVARARHLMQLQMADGLVGRIIARLRTLGEWDDTTFVLTADHGVSFTSAAPLRSVSRANYPEIMWTPLFVKASGQTEGEIHDAPVLSVDVIPTLADLIGVRIPWSVDGRSALGAPRRSDARPLYQFAADVFEPSNTLRAPAGSNHLTFDGRAGFARLLAAQAAPAGGDPVLRTNRLGPYADLVGRTVEDLPITDPAPRATLAVPGGRAFGALDPTAQSVPWAYLETFLSHSGAHRDLAIAVNGRIVFVAPITHLSGSPNAFVPVIVPPAATQPGPNPLRAYFVEGPPDAPRLVPTGALLGA